MDFEEPRADLARNTPTRWAPPTTVRAPTSRCSARSPRSVELCLFDADGTETRVELPEVDGFVWHAFLPGVEPGQRYGYRVHGPNDPAKGLRCNPNKLLLDPYAKAIDGTIEWDESLFGYHWGDEDSHNDDDSAAHLPKCVVINPYFDWGVDRPPKRAVRRHASSTRRTSRA